jgi:hypothetical protein
VLCLSTGGRSRKARNLRAEARCAIHVDSDDPVVVHGVARFAQDPEEIARVSAAYAAKYGDRPPERDAKGGGPAPTRLPPLPDDRGCR